MDFQQAQAGFQRLEGQFRAGAISAQQYQAGLNELRVTDPWGRLWMLQEHSGIWHVNQNGVWVPAQPPVTAPPPAYPVPPPAQQAPYPAYSAPQPTPQVRDSAENPYGNKPEPSLLFKYMRMIFIFVLVWIVIGGAYWIFYGSSHGSEGRDILMGIGVASVLSLILMLWSLRDGWKGQVVDEYVIQEEHTDANGITYQEDVRYVSIRETSGKMRQEAASPKWQLGDWLEKKQGENWVRKL